MLNFVKLFVSVFVRLCYAVIVQLRLSTVVNKQISDLIYTHTVVVPDGIDDSTVTIECHVDDAVGRYKSEIPQWLSPEPHVTDQLIPDAVT